MLREARHLRNPQIAATLAADAVGYRRLAGANEDRPLARLRALRSDLIDPTIAVHHANSAAWSTPRAGSCPHARPDFYTRLRGQGLKDNVSANALQIFQPNSNWEATCVTAFEQYWRLRYRFG